MTTDRLSLDLMVSTARFVRFLRQGAVESTATWRALAILDQYGPMRVGDFAAHDQLTQPTATAMLRRLRDEGAVTRVPDPSDGRAHLVGLTDAGRDRLASLRARAAQRVGPLLADLTDDDRDTLARATRILVQLTEIPPPAAADETPDPTPSPDERTTA